MNAMVFYDPLSNSLKCLGPEPVPAACVHPTAERSIAIFATTDIIV